MGKSAWKAAARKRNIPEIEAFCEDQGLPFRYIAGDWHVRIDSRLDVYPTRKRFFDLKTKAWGWYEDYEHLGRILAGEIIDRIECGNWGCNDYFTPVHGELFCEKCIKKLDL